VPDRLTEITEVTTALGMLGADLGTRLARRHRAVINVSDASWVALVQARDTGQYAESFRTAFENGRAFLRATDGLRGRPPLRIEWKGGHRPPGDDVIPADLRIDHVYLVSCKYLSKVLLNAGPARLFDRLLVGLVEQLQLRRSALLRTGTSTSSSGMGRVRSNLPGLRSIGQPEVAWRASVERRDDRARFEVDGHVAIRWSHGRFYGTPEAKVCLDTPHVEVPGYNLLA